jgi:TM2 domain-containing membrane protein YozV
MPETLRPTRHPGVAAVLSLVIPGAGQMYRGDIGAGFIWLVVTDQARRRPGMPS